MSTRSAFQWLVGLLACWLGWGLGGLGAWGLGALQSIFPWSPSLFFAPPVQIIDALAMTDVVCPEHEVRIDICTHTSGSSSDSSAPDP